MANQLTTLKDLADADLGQIVYAVNALVSIKNKLASDADLVAFVSFDAAAFEALGCSATVAAAAVDAMAGLKAVVQATNQQITAERFPPNAV